MAIERSMQTELLSAARSYPVVTVLGPRQSGKTTLVKAVFAHLPYANLEDPDTRSFATGDPREFLSAFPGGVILDEIQRVPQLLSYLQGMVDEDDRVGRFVLTGSHQLALQEAISQSLAGRTAMLHLMPLSIQELAEQPSQLSLDEQMYHGFYPRIYHQDLEPHRFYGDYVQTYVERDVKQMLNVKDLEMFQRFIHLCAARVGQLVDLTGMANELGLSRHTVRSWLSIMQASFILTSLPPYFENLGKRVIKSSKLYFNDVGLVAYLLGIREPSQIAQHPMRGALFENMMVNEIAKWQLNHGESAPMYFYRDANQLEIDVLLQHGDALVAIEIKSSATFNLGFLKGLKRFEQMLDRRRVRGYLVYAGEHQQKVHHAQVVNYRKIPAVFVD